MTAAGTPIALDFHSVVFERDKTVAEIELLNRGANLSGARVPLDFAAAAAAFKSAPIDLKQFIFEWIGQVADESLRHFAWATYQGGTDMRPAEGERTFELGELHWKLRAELTVHVACPAKTFSF